MYKKKIDLSAYHIMLVDEHPVSLASYQSILREAGFQVSSSIYPQSALNGIRSGVYDLVLFSISQLETCIFQAVKLCRDMAHQKNIPLLVLSSMGRRELYARHFVDGVDYLQKPMLTSELIMRVGIWVRQSADIKKLQ